MPIAALSDPHMGDAAKNPDRTEKIIGLILFLSIAFFAVAGAAYVQNWSPWTFGGALGAGLFALGFGLTAWGKYLMPQGPFVEERHTLASTPEERDSMSAALVERSAVVVKRRKVLGGLFAAGATVFGIVAAFPLIRSLGPLPGTSLETTGWRKGMVLVDSTGRPVRRDTLIVGGIMTVYPQDTVDPQNGFITDQGQAVDQTVLIRVSDEPFTTEPGRENWTPDGYVAYSKLCTHLGCPVGLYEQDLELLVCPCHQSMFNVRNGAVPEFGPAPRPLPQMHLGYNEDGYLIAMAPYDQAGKIVGELDDRLGVAKGGRVFLDKIFPDHWSFMLGEISLYSFVVLLATGVFLSLYFVPSSQQVIYHGSHRPLDGQWMSEAYKSTVQISLNVRGGLLVRQMHHWAADIFTGSIIVHMGRIFFTGAFRKPRELNWVIGTTMLILAILEGFIGYSLVTFLWGGQFPGNGIIIPRFFIIHVLIIPLVLIGLLSAHLGLLVRQKHTQFKGEGRTENNVVGSPMFPTFMAKTTGFLFMVTAASALLGAFAQINPIWQFGSYEPSKISYAVQPDWYMGWLDGALRIMPSWEWTGWGYTIPFEVLLPAVVFPGLIFTIAGIWPALDKRMTGDVMLHNLLDRPRDRPKRTAAGAAML